MNVRILVMLTGFFVFSAIGMPAPKPSLIKIIRDKEKSEDQKIAAIEQLIKEGINVNTKSEDIPYFTPLMIAADLGYINVVKALLDRGADINAMDNLHTPAIFYAARKGHIDIVQLLISRGAVITGITKQGNTILLDILRSYGANQPDAKDKQRRDQFKKNILSVIELLIKNGADINKQGNTSELARNPIMWAAFWKDLNLIKLLKEKGADLTRKDQFGNDLSFYLPDPSKDKDLTPADIAFIRELREELLESGWTQIKKPESLDSSWREISK